MFVIVTEVLSHISLHKWGDHGSHISLWEQSDTVTSQIFISSHQNLSQNILVKCGIKEHQRCQNGAGTHSYTRSRSMGCTLWAYWAGFGTSFLDWGCCQTFLKPEHFSFLLPSCRKPSPHHPQFCLISLVFKFSLHSSSRGISLGLVAKILSSDNII